MTAKIKLNAASGGGSFSLQAPSSSSNTRVMTLPDTADGTILTTTNPKSGNILQVVSTTKKDSASFSVASEATHSYTDSSLRATITPSSASNKILITAMLHMSVDSSQYVFTLLQKDGSTISDAIGDAAGSNRTRSTSLVPYPADAFSATQCISINYLDTAGNTNSRYYNFAFKHSSGLTRTMYLNRSGVNDGDNFVYGRLISTITAMEVAA
tara:strand:+ start:13 stop:648 length:636 start_codon:yes stop_codon:yes gene_type:complete